MEVGERGLEVDCVVFCPAYRISNGIATFIVDTGSERIFLSWEDAKRFEIPVEDLPHHHKPIIGFGGAAEARVAGEVFHLVFETAGGGTHLETIPEGLLIWRPPKRRKRGRDIPIPGVNILGRDFLKGSRFGLHADIANRLCSLRK